MKKNRFLILMVTMFCFLFGANLALAGHDPLSLSERESLCSRLEKAAAKQTELPQTNTILPDSVFENIYTATQSIYDNVAIVSILGDALMCHAVHGDRNEIKVGPVVIFDYPKISVFLCGWAIFVFGFMLLFTIAFYIVDICFKLGLAAVLLPIGVALWPFAWTRDKLAKLISIILKSAAIFAFLAITVAYGVNMMMSSLGGMDQIFEAISKNDTDFISEHFTLFSMRFLIVVACFIYAIKLIGATIPDYVDKLFPDNVFGGGKGSQPIHMLTTQATDFVKKKVAEPVATFGRDVMMKKAGQATEGVGKLLAGDYNKNLKTAFHNPDAVLDKVGLNINHKISRVGAKFQKAYNNASYGAKIAWASRPFGTDKLERHDAKEALRQQRNAKNMMIDENVENKYNAEKERINQGIEANEQAYQQMIQEKESNSRVYKIARKITKGVDKVLQKTVALPGQILKGTGQAMQDNRERISASRKAAEAEEELKREKEEAAQAKREDRQQWK